MMIKEFLRPFSDDTKMTIIAENDYTYEIKTAKDLKGGPLGDKEIKEAKMSKWLPGLEILIASFL